MNYNILEFDSSNIKILNDIETISGKIKVNGVDKFQETSNFIISTSNILTTQVTSLNNTVLDTNSKIKSTVLPKSTSTDLGAVKVDGTTITIDSATGVISGSQSVDLSDYATKEYADSISSGLTFKDNVKAATVGNSSLSGLNDIDGIGVITGDRIFVFSQTNEAENGIYIAASGSWTRATDFNTTANITSGSFIFIANGNVNGNSGYVCNISSAISTVGTDPITFSKFSSAGQLYAGDGILKNGNTLSLKPKTDGGIVVDTTGGSINLSKSLIAGTLPISKGGTGATNLDNLITLGEHTTGNYVENITSGNGISVTGANAEKATVNLSVDTKANGGLTFDTDNKLELDLSATSISGILGQANGGTGNSSLNTDIITEGTNNKFIVNNLYNAPLTVSGDILPSLTQTYNLGSPDYKWKSLYVAADTIHIGDTQLSAGTEGGIEMSAISFTDTINKISSNELHSLKGVTKNVQQQINDLNLDDIADGATNKYIVNDTYNGTISVASNFNVGKYFSTENPNGNLHVYGDITIEGNINTVSPLITQYHRHLSNYNIGYTDITNVDDTSNRPSIKIEHNVGYSNIMEISCKGDDGVFIITSNGNIGINKLEPTEKIDIDGNILFTGTINDITTTELSYLDGLDYNIKTRIDTNNLNQSNYVLSSSNLVSQDIIRINRDTSNYTKNSSNILRGYVNTLNQDTSNYVNTIKTSQGNLHSSNYIKSTSNIITNHIKNLNADDITNGTTNKYIINNTYPEELSVSGDFTVNGANTTINSVLYSSNYVELINNSANTAFTITQYDPLNDVFSVNTTDELFKIKSNGNIGIGTTPSRKLDVDGDIKFTGKLYQGDSEFITSYWLKNGNDISISSNVTITGDLTVSGTTATLNTDVYATEQVDILYTGADSIAFKVKQTTSADKILVAENNTGEVFSITQSGDLNFKGGLYQDGTAFQTSYWDKAENNELYYTAANVGIGTNIPAEKLHVVGQIVATNKITSFYSDERLKTDIELIPDPLNIIEQLNGFYYKPNELANSFGIESNHRELGLSAQEVKKVLPELVDLAPLDIARDKNDNIVSKSGENYLTVSYDKMIPVIIESIKKLNSEIKLLKEENKLLKESIKKNS